MNRYDVGDIAPLRLLVEPSAPDTVVTLVSRSPTGDEQALATSPNGDRSEWTSAVRLTAPGLWRQTWTVTGTGAGVETHTVSVRPTLDGTRTYATTSDLAAWLGDAVPELAPVLLARATRVVDRLTRGLVWTPRPGTDNLPDDPLIAAALADATCAQAAAWIEAGLADQPDDLDDEGLADLAALAAAGASSVAFGAVSFGLGGRAASGPAQTPDWTTPADATVETLRTHGVYPVRPWVLG